MSLFLTLAHTVGPAVVKAIVATWLKDPSLATDASADLVGLIAAKTNDLQASRSAHREFEEMGDRVAQSLLPLFEAADLDEGSQSAVAEAAAAVLSDAPIDAEMLAKHDLDPDRLAKSLFARHPDADRDFTEAEEALFHRVIVESAISIVDIAAQLPTYSERTLGEVLSRQRQLIEITDRILAQFEALRLRSQADDPGEVSARFEVDYLRAVERRLNQVELFGVDVAAPNRRHPLSVAYVTLSVEERAQGSRAAPDDGDITDDADFDADLDSVVLSAHVALARSSRLMVLGPPGSGKTTLLKWVSVRAATRSFPDELAAWNENVPFFIRLRQLADRDLPAPEEFPALVARNIAGEMPPGWVHEQLRSGRALVLIDGVDEVSQQQQEAVREWIRGLVADFETARFVVSSRPYAVEEDWLARDDFHFAELQEMGSADIDIFIDHWHDAVREELNDPTQREALDELAHSMKEAIRSSPRIRDLAKTPLLCAMLCALHRTRNRKLPRDRIDLYDAGVNMLLRRDRERNVDLGDYVDIQDRRKLVLLQDFAYWMVRNGLSAASVERTDDCFARKLVSMVGLSEVTPAQVRILFVERIGLLRQPMADDVDFAHRTFQEYLAAIACADVDDIDLLVENAHDVRWREVVILTAGTATSRQRNALIQGLIDRGDKEEEQRHQLHFLAVACLETATNLDPALQYRVEKRLSHLVPPRNMTEAQALTSAGDLAVPHLSWDVDHSVSVAAACVRTLVLIDTPASIGALQPYCSDQRQSIQQELVNYLNAALENMRYADFPALRLSFITRLDSEWKVVNLNALTGLTNLEYLDLRSTGVADVSALSGLTKLGYLNLSETGVTDVSALSGLINLTILALSDTGVTDVSAFSGLTNLRELYLSGTGVTDVSALSGLINLEYLNLSKTGVTDVSALTSLNRLRIYGVR